MVTSAMLFNYRYWFLGQYVRTGVTEKRHFFGLREPGSETYSSGADIAVERPVKDSTLIRLSQIRVYRKMF